MASDSSAPTKSQVNRAGKHLRALLLQTQPAPSGDQLSAAIQTLFAFRAAHAYPLSKATMGLRQRVAREGCQVEVSQRLKRAPTIVDKLRREPTMALSTMRDIGGCRAVLESMDELRRVESRFLRRTSGPVVDHHDYVSEPKPSGYRAVHLTVCYDGRLIEVQLRTRVMHEWAVTVERLTSRMDEDFKSGEGSDEVQAFLQAASEAMAVEESLGVVSPELASRVSQLRAAAVPFLVPPTTSPGTRS